jgi:hypothetical protein
MRLKVGRKVSHLIFGQGVITAVTNVGGDPRVTVNFDRCGSKTLVPNIANLVPVNGSGALFESEAEPVEATHTGSPNGGWVGSSPGKDGAEPMKPEPEGRKERNMLTDDQREQVRKLIMAGETTGAIMRITGVGHITICNIRKEFGAETPKCKCGKESGHKGRCYAGKVSGEPFRVHDLPSPKKLARRAKVSMEKSGAHNASLETVQQTQRVSVEHTQVVTRRAAADNPILNTGEQIEDLASIGADQNVLFWGRPVSPEFLDCLWLNLKDDAKAWIMEHLTDLMFPCDTIVCPLCKGSFPNPFKKVNKE